MRWWSFWRFGKRDVKGRKLKSFSSARFLVLRKAKPRKIGLKGRSPKQFSSATFAGPLEKLSPGKSALFADHSLSEPLRGEFELSANAFS